MLDAIEAPRVAEPFAFGGHENLLSPSDQRLLVTMLAGMWVAGQSSRWATFVVTLPRPLLDRVIEMVERAPLDDIEPVHPDSVEDGEQELEILWRALRGKEREQGAVQWAERSARRKAKERHAVTLKHQPE